MEWEIEKRSSPEYLVVKTKGEFSLIDFELIWHDILNRDSWRPAMPILFDNRLIDLRSVGQKEVEEAGKIFLKYRAQFAECPIAVVVSEGVPYGLGRSFQLIANRRTHASFEIFTERRKAENWLIGPPEQF